MTKADYTYDLALLANSSAQIESLLATLEKAVKSISLFMNACVLNKKDLSLLEVVSL